MSDKSKKLRDEALIRRQAAKREAQAKPVPIIRCQCGKPPEWGVTDKGKTTYYCDGCLPGELR